MSDFLPVDQKTSDMRELLRWVYDQSRVALFQRSHRSAGAAALKALSEINKRTVTYK